MKNRFFLALFLSLPLVTKAAVTRTIGVDQNDVLSAPTNFLNTNFISGRIILVDVLNGNNTTARKYTTKAFASPVYAVSNAVSGDTVLLNPGNYILSGSNVIKLPHGVNLKGRDRASTWITKTNGDAAGPLLTPGSGSLISDLTFIGWTPGGDDPTNLMKIISPEAWTPAVNQFWTNATFVNCDLIGETDVYFVSGSSPCSARFESCRFRSQWDTIVTGNSPHYTEFFNCDLVADARSHTNGRVGVFGEVTILKTAGGSTNLFYNCRVIATNSHIPAVMELTKGAMIVFDNGGKAQTQYTAFANCFLTAAGTNMANRFAGADTNNWINSNNIIRVYNCNPQTIYPFNTNYFADCNDEIIVFTNTGPARSLTLPNIAPRGLPVYDGLELTIIDGTTTGFTNTILVRSILGQVILPVGIATTNITGLGGILKLQVRGTNWCVVNTVPIQNFLDNAVVNNVFVNYDATTGQGRWTNALYLSGGILNVKYTNFINTVSNFVFDLNKTNIYSLWNQTNVVFTNIVKLASEGHETTMKIYVHNTTGVTMGLRWPAYGAQHGYFFRTNVSSPILTTVTLATGQRALAEFKADGSNILGTVSIWP